MSGPRLAELSAELKALQERWLQLPRTEQDELYAREFASPFAKLFARLPLHGAPDGMARPRALISVLRLSWQPVALDREASDPRLHLPAYFAATVVREGRLLHAA